MGVDLGSFEQKVEAAERQMRERVELSSKDIDELRRIAVTLVGNKSKKAVSLIERITAVEGENIAIHNSNYIGRVADSWDRLRAEFKDPNTPPERKRRIAEELEIISKVLRLWQM